MRAWRLAACSGLVLVAAACGGSERTSDADAAVGEDAARPDGGGGGIDGGGGGGLDAGSDSGEDEPPDYARLFPADRILDIDLTFTDEAWDTLMADPMQDVYVPARLTYDGIIIEQVAVRLKGNSSRNSVQRMGSERYSFKVDIDREVDGQKLLGIDKFNLNNGFKDPSFMRERLAAVLYAAFEIPTIRTAHARLSRNGEYFGLYTVVEQVDMDFLREHFPDDSGDLYKPEPPAGDLTWHGDSLAAYPGLELETNQDSPDHDSIIELLDVLNNTTPDELEAQLPEVFDIEGFLRYLAVTVALVNLDSYLGMSHNYYLYEDRSTGRFVLIPWDLNEAYGNFWCRFDAQQLIDLPYDQPVCDDPARRPLVTRILSVPAWRQTLEGHLADLLSGDWAPEFVYQEVHDLADMIRDDVITDPTSFFPPQDFETSLDEDIDRPGPGTGLTFGLTSFSERRAEALLGQL